MKMFLKFYLSLLYVSGPEKGEFVRVVSKHFTVVTPELEPHVHESNHIITLSLVCNGDDLGDVHARVLAFAKDLREHMSEAQALACELNAVHCDTGGMPYDSFIVKFRKDGPYVAGWDEIRL